MKTWIFTFVAFCIGAVLVTTIYRLPRTKIGPTTECLAIRAEVSGRLTVGDTEHSLRNFFKERGWRFSTYEPLGIYNVNLDAPQSKGGERHLIRIHVVVKDGFIVSIDISDVFKTL